MSRRWAGRGLGAGALRWPVSRYRPCSTCTSPRRFRRPSSFGNARRPQCRSPSALAISRMLWGRSVFARYACNSPSVISGGRSPSSRFFSFMGCAISPPKRLVASRLDIVCSARKFSRNFFRRSGFASPVVKSACRLPRRRAKSHTPGTSEAARPGPPPFYFRFTAVTDRVERSAVRGCGRRRRRRGAAGRGARPRS